MISLIITSTRSRASLIDTTSIPSMSRNFSTSVIKLINKSRSWSKSTPLKSRSSTPSIPNTAPRASSNLPLNKFKLNTLSTMSLSGVKFCRFISLIRYKSTAPKLTTSCNTSTTDLTSAIKSALVNPSYSTMNAKSAGTNPPARSRTTGKASFKIVVLAIKRNASTT